MLTSSVNGVFNFMDNILSNFFLRKPSKLGSLSKNICMCTVCVSVCCVCLFKILSLLQWFMLKYFNSESSFKLRWCCARDLFGSQIPVTTGGFELQISCIRSSYLTHQAIRPDDLLGQVATLYARFAVQTTLWSLKFVIQINLEHDTISSYCGPSEKSHTDKSQQQFCLKTFKKPTDYFPWFKMIS